MWLTELTESTEDMCPIMDKELARIGGIVIDREVDMFSQSMKNSPRGEVLNIMMEESGEFLVNKVNRIQGKYAFNDISRAGMHGWHGC